jgi:hypothetical protein
MIEILLNVYLIFLTSMNRFHLTKITQIKEILKLSTDIMNIYFVRKMKLYYNTILRNTRVLIALIMIFVISTPESTSTSSFDS